ncbi:MAG: YwaF family protein [Firmicutes bacterium]|nr:YwaF family protein [Bacillota bacterium]
MFSLKHVILFLFTAAAIVTALVLCGIFVKNERGRRWVFLVMIIFNISTEILKIFFYVKNPDPLFDWRVSDVYLQWDTLPFHLCSLFLWLLPIGVFAKGGIKEPIRVFLVYFGIFCGFAPLVASGWILGEPGLWLPILPQTILPLRSFLYHGGIVFTAVFMGMCGWFKPNIKRVTVASGAMAAILVITLFLNLYAGTGFNHLTMREDNMFYFLMEAMTFVPYCIFVIHLICSVPFIFHGVFLLARKIIARAKDWRMKVADTGRQGQ